MTVRRGISEVEGVQDPKAAQLLREIKAVLEGLTGRLPQNPPVKRLGPGASLSGVNNKVNELIGRLQDDQPSINVTGLVISTSSSGASIPDPLLLGNGSASAPTYSFSADSNTGIYRFGADRLGVAVGGLVALFGKSGSNVFLNGPDAASASSNGPDFSINAGAGGATSGNGGRLQLIAGSAITEGAGGAIIFEAGDAAGTDHNGGAFTFLSGNGIGNGAGGLFSISGGNGGADGASGAVQIYTTDGGATSGNSASISLTTGNTTSGDCGGIIFATGTPTGGVNGNISFKTNTSTEIFRLNGTTQHTSHLGTAPSITAGGGTNPSIVGKDEAFIVTIGTGGVATSVEVTFANAFTNAPAAVAMSDTDIVALTTVALTNKVTIAVTAPFTAGSKISVICRGYE